MGKIKLIIFLFAWPDGDETSLQVRVNHAGTPVGVTMVGAPAKLLGLADCGSVETIRAEAELFAAMGNCTLTIEKR